MIRFFLCIAMIFPAVMTTGYAMELLPSFLQKAVYLSGKTVQFSLPLIFLYWIGRTSEPDRRERSSRIAEGVVFGLLVVGLMVLLVEFLLPREWFEQAGAAIREKLTGMDMFDPFRYAILGVFYAMIHSLLEEYYWRWFVFRQLGSRINGVAAAVLSAASFTVHHVIILGVYFEWKVVPAALMSAGVFLGGLYWAWLYHRTARLREVWISHMIVDAGIFVIGYRLLFGGV